MWNPYKIFWMHYFLLDTFMTTHWYNIWHKNLTILLDIWMIYWLSKITTLMYTQEIHPVELTLIKADTDNDHYPFLNLDIYTIKRKLNTKLEALKSLCRSPWSMCIHVLNKGYRWIHDKIVFWWWWCVCRFYFTEHSCYLQFSLSTINLAL